MKIPKIGIVAVGIAAGIVALPSCSATKTDAPEPTSSNIVDGKRTQVIRMPNGFRNIVFSCYGPNGIYVTSRGYDETAPQASGIAVVTNDPLCTR